MTLDVLVTSASSSSPTTPIILKRTVGEGGGGRGDAEREELVLLVLGCEANPPYGPYHHTATLFLDLICQALQEIQEQKATTNAPTNEVSVVLKVYAVSQGQFPKVPDDYEDCHGVILPGSFSAAYDTTSTTEPWILQLSRVIQTELVAKQRPTLGVCFGHQLYAHSFFVEAGEGAAVKCPAGPQVGRKVSTLTAEGRKWLTHTNNNNKDDDDDDQSVLQLYYTHGDMIERLPPQGVALGGNAEVPIQAAIYFGKPLDGGDDGNEETKQQRQQQQQQQPIMAITFQAHPEYAGGGPSPELGIDKTFHPILAAMQARGAISEEHRQRAQEDAQREYATVQQQSVQTMITAGRLLGWFPKD